MQYHMKKMDCLVYLSSWSCEWNKTWHFLLQIMFSSILNKRLPAESGISVLCVSPGIVQTNVVSLFKTWNVSGWNMYDFILNLSICSFVFTNICQIEYNFYRKPSEIIFCKRLIALLICSCPLPVGKRIRKVLCRK